MNHHQDHVESRSGDLFLERIPQEVYTDLVETLTRRYGFVNGAPAGGRMRFAEYFLGLRRSAAEGLLDFIREVFQGKRDGRFPELLPPEGFRAIPEQLPDFDREGGIPFGYFDAAVTAEGLRIIEVQSNATYALTAAFAGDFLQKALQKSRSLPRSSAFVHEPGTEWEDLIDLKRMLVAGGETEGIVVADRDLLHQKTSFELHATRCELDVGLDVIDTSWIFEKDEGLWFRDPRAGSVQKKIRRIYHRTLPLEAIEEDGYPRETERWKFRFDRPYADLTHVSHPGKNFEISKHVLPYVSHPLNPPCYELADIAESFRRGEIGEDELVWKHKLGVAGRGLFLLPDTDILDRLTRSDQLGEYVAQSKVDFERFTSADGREKIIELRFMTVQTAERLIVVPMARIGHVRTHPSGRLSYHIHFGENNEPGYGFCPVLVVDD